MIVSLPKVAVTPIVNREQIMKHIRTISSIIAFTLFISACSSPAAPTVDVVSIQNTSIAAALTIVAETMAAVPTSTPLPTETPTETPTQTLQPTETPAVTETPTAIALATSASGNTDPCNAPLGADPLGQPTKIKLENNTGAPINVSVYMNLTPFGQCGYRGYNIGKGSAPVITDLPQACYNVFVWINDPNKPTTSSGSGCINNSDQWTFVITRDKVSLQGR
jgi:hypothetical protein